LSTVALPPPVHAADDPITATAMPNTRALRLTCGVNAGCHCRFMQSGS
jgi:hypothetical protein